MNKVERILAGQCRVLVEGEGLRYVERVQWRKPAKGDYYLSGARPQVWRSGGDMAAPFFVVRLLDGPRP